jgi:hypothetical protein
VPHCVTNPQQPNYGFCAQCTTGTQCTAPTPYCELGFGNANYGLCVVCTATHQGTCTQDAGVFCNSDLDVCEFDCRTDAGVCFPGFCDADAGQPICQPGCIDATNCPTSASICLAGSCVSCIFGDAGCDSGEVCYQDDVCRPDCRSDGGTCVSQFGPGNFCDSDGGMCLPGCQNLGDCASNQRCIASGITGVPGSCNDCLTAADCTAFAGCNANGCGSCSAPFDCPSPLTCDSSDTRWCTCSSDQDCQTANPNAPNCIDAGLGNLCGCSSSDGCPLGTVCDQRAAASVEFAQNGIFNANPPTPYAGYCVARCDVVGGLDCTQVPGLAVCDADSGYCVGCAQDSQCQSPATPHCVPFADAGIDAGASFGTVGGVCGCSDTSQCNDGNTCDTFDFSLAPGVGECVPACQRDAGFVFDNCGLQGASGGFCDTFTGVCFPCLDNYDCINFSVFGPPQNICVPDAGCVECLSFSDCPAALPGCEVSQYRCGYCDTLADCPPDAGVTYACSPAFGSSQSQCVVACSADGGASQCPSGRPLCDVDAGFCAECLKNSDCAKGCCNMTNGTCQPFCILP